MGEEVNGVGGGGGMEEALEELFSDLEYLREKG